MCLVVFGLVTGVVHPDWGVSVSQTGPESPHRVRSPIQIEMNPMECKSRTACILIGLYQQQAGSLFVRGVDAWSIDLTVRIGSMSVRSLLSWTLCELTVRSSRRDGPERASSRTRALSHLP